MTARQSACGQSAANERKDVSLSGQKRLHFFHPEAHQDTKIICFLDWTQFGIWGGMGFFIPMCSIPRLCVGAMKQIWSGIEVQRLHQNSLWEAQCSTDMNAIFLPVLKQALHLFVHFSFKFKNCRRTSYQINMSITRNKQNIRKAGFYTFTHQSVFLLISDAPLKVDPFFT